MKWQLFANVCLAVAASRRVRSAKPPFLINHFSIYRLFAGKKAQTYICFFGSSNPERYNAYGPA